MHLAIDIRCLTGGQTTGIPQYTRSLIEALAKQDPESMFTLFVAGTKSTRNMVPHFSLPNVRIVEAKIPNRLLSLLFSLKLKAIDDYLPEKADAWLLPNWDVVRVKTPYILTIHDLSFEIFPEFFTFKATAKMKYANIRRLARNAAHLLSVSHATKRDLTELWSIPGNKISVTPLSVDHKIFSEIPSKEDVRVRAVHDLNRPYIFALASQEPRKNFLAIIEAYNLFRLKKPIAPPLVLAGAAGWKNKAIAKAIKASPFAKDIVKLGYVPDAHRPALYRGASAFIFPSFYEGFGLPPLEAMACGTPVIASYTGAVAEVIAEAGILIDPMNVSDINQALHELYNEQDGHELIRTLKEAGKKRAHQFTQEQTAEKTLIAIKNAIEDANKKSPAS
ncbi:glycosyltransferase family 4 protein [Patescibacteria group bacterium]|nr:glycosyltransferase family 4 protein [Patescibacteria group bacterium]